MKYSKSYLISKISSSSKTTELSQPSQNVKAEHWARLQKLRRKRESIQDNPVENNAQILQQEMTRRLKKEVSNKRSQVPQEEKGKVVKRFKNLSSAVSFFSEQDKKFQPTPQGRFDPKTQLECEIETAIASGDHELASRLSDKLAHQQQANLLKSVTERKAHAEQLEREEQERKRRKRPRLNWTFEAKKRWESKSNMA
ncbi:uncharacterized protein VTP21DRAFT_5925 [Calcarisporiella thermophila]|uniref:uncharacterized protein n=1 Tax=Calcarisporiella thermophila TaxID=911321 RepID=UPI003744733B